MFLLPWDVLDRVETSENARPYRFLADSELANPVVFVTDGVKINDLSFLGPIFECHV